MKNSYNIVSLSKIIGIFMLGFTLFGCAAQQTSQTAQQSGQSQATAGAQESTPDRVVSQEPGQIVYWVLPGPRRLDPAVFGTPEEPRMLLRPKIMEARQGPYPPSVPQLFMDLPILAGIPMQARSRTPDGGWMLQTPTPFGDQARIVSGSFNAQYYNSIDEDQPLPPDNTPDRAQMTAEFQDPDDNQYRIELDHVVQPPFPGYETEGGVMIDSVHHGATGTGSPLMPEVNTLAAFWGIGDIFINGEFAGSRVVHMMTTDVVRDSDYRLVLEEELPLPPSDRQIADQTHHTHLMVMPVEGGPMGPVFSPAPSAFQLPNGMMQPFMHIMYEQDVIE